jgi:hypothetical protein
MRRLLSVLPQGWRRSPRGLRGGAVRPRAVSDNRKHSSQCTVRWLRLPSALRMCRPEPAPTPGKPSTLRSRNWPSATRLLATGATPPWRRPTLWWPTRPYGATVGQPSLCVGETPRASATRYAPRITHHYARIASIGQMENAGRAALWQAMGRMMAGHRWLQSMRRAADTY